MVPQTTDNVTTTPIPYWPLHLVSFYKIMLTMLTEVINLDPIPVQQTIPIQIDPGGTINYSDEHG